ncbi:solute carrier family 49 member A3 [Lepeophtheirus salmonis]|uniref:solute carrier family 49 member A3 n=1 Tax=Lepeophtheirus salmonis TaxID=72036 RepID=UPI001AE6B9AA|nr:solute carrier family 49 member A3-like [Lepeophtheirus salmonis]
MSDENKLSLNETGRVLHTAFQSEDSTFLNSVVSYKNKKYKSYSERWWLLSSVFLLNIANYSHWVAFPSVSKNAAKYYDQTGDAIDLLSTLSYGSGIPCCIIATYIVESHGLRVGLLFGGVLTGFGGLLCFCSSLPYLSDIFTSDEKFYLALVGQILTGIACPFISCVPTKISQHWFGDNERTIATILLGMSNPLGIVLGQGLTPQIAPSPEKIPRMNILWFIPAAIGSIITIIKVKKSYPPSPPSHSAEMQVKEKVNYLICIKKLMTNFPFIIIFLFLGAAMGYISTLSTKIEQLLCSKGYSDQLSGLSGSLILLWGFIASFFFGFLAIKVKKIVLICKTSGLIVIIFLVLICYVFRLPNMNWLIILSCSLLGIFSLGVYPLALELVVECTYPLDQATPTALIFLSSSLQGVFLMVIENYMGKPLTPEEFSLQSCISHKDFGHQQPKDYTDYLIFITSYMIIFILVFLVFFKTELRRQNVDDNTMERTWKVKI